MTFKSFEKPSPLVYLGEKQLDKGDGIEHMLEATKKNREDIKKVGEIKRSDIESKE